MGSTAAQNNFETCASQWHFHFPPPFLPPTLGASHSHFGCFSLLSRRCNRRIGSLEAKLAAAAAGSSVAALEQQLATARQQQAQLQAQLEAAEAARDAEADRLEAEDAELAEAAAAAAGDQVLPVVAAAGGDKSDEGSSDSGSPAATALVSDLGSCKDTSIEMQELEQQQQKGKQGWLSKLRKH